ncbi:4'-phosphopantetheinyl transferase family protein [Legionella spiritensis]|uniref:Phosphopantetheinyl transferase n=1 Tax=Legionella spiritensis TaxID=452 RepID=A0A0W0YXL8_LEGSP|nr:4'-phosphopantetheinyl transferase superfamily protein [Legionella spiritensis]KTD61620.1 phosphopantetheinyl transferase [Legionella spiritensis]SNV39355.1 phosphopantetheinyl transferase [Legionella spiritensis]
MRYDNLNCILTPPLILIMSMSLFQIQPAFDFQMRPDNIDIWQIPLHTLPDRAFDLLQGAEQQRAGRFHFPRHQRRFTVARAMLRALLAHYLKKDPTLLDFSYNEHGKPYLQSTRQLEFNLSHSGDWALLAVGQQHALGIDLEFFSARPYLGIARHLFSEAEIQTLSQLPRPLRPIGFFNIWAQKEAFIKAVGLGLSYPTKQFDVPVLPVMRSSIKDHETKKNWQMIPFMPKAACSAALCCHPNVTRFRYYNLRSLDKFADTFLRNPL